MASIESIEEVSSSIVSEGKGLYTYARKIKTFDYDSFDGWQKTFNMVLSMIGFFSYIISLMSAFVLIIMESVMWFRLHTEKKGHQRDPIYWLFYCFDRYTLNLL